MNEYISIKLLMLGDSGVGKTSLMTRFSDDFFDDNMLSTAGVDFKTKIIEMMGKNIKIAIWDTAGQERFRTITKTYYQGAHGIILMYDVGDKDSFSNLLTWLTEIQKHTNKHVKKILVGNKIDMEDQRVISYDQGLDIAKSYDMPFFETSAKTSTNVKTAFENICSDIVSSGSYQNPQLSSRPSVIAPKPSEQNSKCCYHHLI